MTEPATVGVIVTAELLAPLCPHTPRALLDVRVAPVQRMLELGNASAPRRAAGVIANVLAETAGLRLVLEEQSPDNTAAQPFDRYLGRMGNRTLADCLAFRGVDFLQSTGRDGATADTRFAQGLGLPVDFVAHPELRAEVDYLGIASARYLVEHPELLACCDAGDIDGARCWVNAGCAPATWIARHGRDATLDVHGQLLDARVAAELDRSSPLPGGARRHGLYGLQVVRDAYPACLRAFGC